MRTFLSRRPSPSLVISLLALFVALGGSAYALSRGEVKTRNIAKGAVTGPKLHTDAVTSAKVKNLSLRLRDIGGQIDHGTQTLGPDTVPAHGCVPAPLRPFNPLPKAFVGSLVIGFVSDGQGGGALDNNTDVVPTVVSRSSQGGGQLNLMVCNGSGVPQTVPAGSVVHFRLISP